MAKYTINITDYDPILDKVFVLALILLPEADKDEVTQDVMGFFNKYKSVKDIKVLPEEMAIFYGQNGEVLKTVSFCIQMSSIMFATLGIYGIDLVKTEMFIPAGDGSDNRIYVYTIR